MRQTPLLWAVFSLSASGLGLPKAGPLEPGIGVSDEDRQISADAGRQPNATSAIEFTRKYDNKDETWTWRVNITEIRVPDDINKLGEDDADFSKNLRIVNTQWQLEWPGDDDTFQTLLQKRNVTVGFRNIVSVKPKEITDRYNEDDNGDCAPVLGDDCTKSLTAAASKGSQFSLNDLDGCKDTLNVNVGTGEHFGDVVGFDIAPKGNSSDSDQPLYHRNDTLNYETSVQYEAGNTTLFDQATGALQVFIMNFKQNDNTGEIGESSGATVLCRVVDKEKATDPPAEGQPQGEDPGENAATASWSQSAVLWGLVALSTILVARS